MTRCQIENLEGRRLMDATMPVTSAPEPSNCGALEMGLDTQAIPRVRSTVPSLVGTWQGTISIGGGYKGHDFRLQVAKLTKTTLTGTVTIGGQTYKGSGTLHWNGRNFSLRYTSKGGVWLALQGTVNANGKSLYATATAIGKVIGYMDATKIA